MSETAATQSRPATAGFLPYLALVFGILGLGLSAIFVRWAGAPGAVSGFYRVAIAATVMALPAASQVRRQAPLSRRHVWFAILAGIFFAGDLTSWNTAVLISNAANSTLLANTSPLWVGIGALLIFRERLRSLFWAGLIAAMVGAFIILGRDFIAHPTFGLGDLLALLAGFFYGAFFLATQRAREGLSSLVSWWISALVSAITMLLFSFALRQPLVGYPPATYLNLAAVALITQVGAYISVNYALGHLPASIVAPTLLGQPVLTALLAIWLLNEPITGWQVLGGVMVLLGIWLVNRSQAQPAPT